jgi:hypothetical protein
VEAPPEAVWPWIAQLGFGRAGWYSYDLLDNLGRHSAETVIPSLQEIHVGDVVPMGPGGAGLHVKDLVAGEWLLWWDGVGYSTWLWSLEQVAPGRTRLVTRVRLRYRWTPADGLPPDIGNYSGVSLVAMVSGTWHGPGMTGRQYVEAEIDVDEAARNLQATYPKGK